MLKFNQRTTDIEKHFKIWGMSYGIWKTLENNGILYIYIYHQQLMIFAFKISQDSPNTKKFLFLWKKLVNLGPLSNGLIHLINFG